MRKEGRWGERNKRSSSSNKGLQRKKLETVTLPVTQLTSPDRVKKKRKKKKRNRRGEVGRSQERNDEGLKKEKKRRRKHKLR